jgi:hypothetical protein
MSDVVSFPQAASQELIAKLVEAGYLEPGLCNDAVAVANTIARLKQELRGGGDDGGPKARSLCLGVKTAGAQLFSPTYRETDVLRRVGQGISRAADEYNECHAIFAQPY